MKTTPSRRLAVISKDRVCIDKIITTAKSHPTIREAKCIDSFDTLQCDGTPLGCKKSASLPDLFFIDLTSDRSTIEAFLEKLQCEFPETTEHSIILIDTPDHIDSIMAFSLKPCVRVVLNKPVLPAEIVHAIDQSLPQRAVPK